MSAPNVAALLAMHESAKQLSRSGCDAHQPVCPRGCVELGQDDGLKPRALAGALLVGAAMWAGLILALTHC